ncbi:hypothetical protein BGZ82_010071 [Podila clonocystis]|nr:hypothetical protein BGZ82_010071 [Podila clonocystis]
MKIISVAAALLVVVGVVQAAPFPSLAKRKLIDVNVNHNKVLVKTDADVKAKDINVLKRNDRGLLGLDVNDNDIRAKTDVKVDVHDAFGIEIGHELEVVVRMGRTKYQN